MCWLPMVDGILPIGDVIYLGGIGVTAAIGSIGIDNIARFFSEVPNALQQLIQQAGDKAKTISDAVQQSASNSSPSPRGPNWGKGFRSFDALKKYLGSPGEGNEWHHIVEQCQIKRSGFAAETIQNVNNVINISKKHIDLFQGYTTACQIRFCLVLTRTEWSYAIGLLTRVFKYSIKLDLKS